MVTYALQTVFRFKLLGRIHIIVDQGETSGFATTESSAKHKDCLFVRLVQFGQFLTQIILADIGQTWMQNINDLSSF
jgi:hypothetical protein